MAVGGNPVFANNNNFNGRPARRGQLENQGYLGNAGTTTGAGPQYSAEDLRQMYTAPSAGSAQTGRMTYDDVIMKTVGTLAMVLVGAAVGWFIPALILPGMLIGFVLAMVNTFKKQPSPALILAYAGFEGLFLGGLSGVLETVYPGIVIQAVIGTFSVFAVTLVLFKSGKVRATPKATKFFMIALGGYAVFSFINLGLMMFHATNSPWGINSIDIPGTHIPFGLIIGALAIGLAAFSLIVDFTSIQRGVDKGLPARYSWTAAFGLTVTLVWLYVEILRLLAILRGNN